MKKRNEICHELDFEFQIIKKHLWIIFQQDNILQKIFLNHNESIFDFTDLIFIINHNEHTEDDYFG